MMIGTAIWVVVELSERIKARGGGLAIFGGEWIVVQRSEILDKIKDSY